MIVHDRLYRKISLPAYFPLHHPLIQRLHHVSLTAVPSWLLPASVAASKYEHSLGTLYLATLATQNPEFQSHAIDICLAALLHDVGTPPFSHLTEAFLYEQTGLDHEAYAAQILREDASLVSFIEELGGSLNHIIQLIQGKDPLGIVAGPLDLDNLDNSLRFGYSLGLIPRMYDPTFIARGLTVIENRLALRLPDTSSLQAWENCRQAVYRFVYSPSNNAPGMMLYRALALAFEAGVLKPDFYRLTDLAAYNQLTQIQVPAIASLMSNLQNGHYYHLAFNLTTSTPSESLKVLVDKVGIRRRLSDELASELGMQKEAVSVFLRKDKGFKRLTLPIVDPTGSLLSYEQSSEERWLIQVYLAPDSQYAKEAISSYLHSRLDI